MCTTVCIWFSPILMMFPFDSGDVLDTFTEKDYTHIPTHGAGGFSWSRK